MLATLTDTARAGAVYASSHPKATAESIQQVALADATNMKPSPKIVTRDTEDASENAHVKVTASTTFSTPLPNSGSPSTINLSRSVVNIANRAKVDMTGTIHAPNRPVAIAGGAHGANYGTQFIVKSLSISNGVKVTINTPDTAIKTTEPFLAE